jgi:hypothetical protein
MNSARASRSRAARAVNRETRVVSSSMGIS